MMEVLNGANIQDVLLKPTQDFFDAPWRHDWFIPEGMASKAFEEMMGFEK